MKYKYLVVVDMQKDFVTGSLRNENAIAIVDNVVNKIREEHDKNLTRVLFTKDTHFRNYLETEEGKHLPVLHCIYGTDGRDLIDEITDYINEREREQFEFLYFDKYSFGSFSLAQYFQDQFTCLHTSDETDEFEIELIGVCTDICVVTNALMIKSCVPEAKISVDSSCCAGTSKEAHEAALAVMRSCHINVY